MPPLVDSLGPMPDRVLADSALARAPCTVLQAFSDPRFVDGAAWIEWFSLPWEGSTIYQRISYACSGTALYHVWADKHDGRDVPQDTVMLSWRNLMSPALLVPAKARWVPFQTKPDTEGRIWSMPAHWEKL